MRHTLRSTLWSATGVLCLAACSATPSGRGETAGGQALVSEPSSASPRTRAASVPQVASDLLTAEITTVGWDQLTGSPIVLLREVDSGQVLPIWIGLAEARAISFELHGVDVPRPMTHDLMTDLIETLGAELEEVVVNDLREGTYYGLLKLRLENEPAPRWVDTRPSDGLALALRTDARIRVAKKLLDELPSFEFRAPDSAEQVVRALGLTVVAPSPELRQQFSLPPRDGLVVIASSGQAKRLGLERGDLIVALDGQAPRQPLDLLDAIEGHTTGNLKVTYWRGGEETTVELDVDIPDRPRSKGVA